MYLGKEKSHTQLYHLIKPKSIFRFPVFITSICFVVVIPISTLEILLKPLGKMYSIFLSTRISEEI